MTDGWCVPHLREPPLDTIVKKKAAMRFKLIEILCLKENAIIF
jgi:hypothetical protein